MHSSFKLRRRALIVCAALLCGPQAQAMDMSVRGGVAFLSGEIKPGDEFKLRALLRDNKISVIELSSPGGFIAPATEMARDIRKAGLTTYVNAGKERCSSACTGLFVAGVRRHFVNSEGKDRLDGKAAGLGFHAGNSFDASGRRAQSGPATAHMIDLYYEMGAPAAADFSKNATSDGMFYISGATAMAKGIATSLSAP